MLLRQLLEGSPLALADSEITGLTQNSRDAGAGTLFFAIEGSSRDGHEFVADVLVRGAIAVVRAGHPRIREMDHARLIEVADTREALGRAASRFYGEPSKNLVVCGVTGTNGKTTSTYLMEAVLSAASLPTAVIGTVEYRLGSYRVESSHTTPDALGLQRLLRDFADRGARAVAMEVSSHAIDQKRVAGMKFDAAIFTNLTQDHLDYHPTMEDYYLAKAKLFLDYPLRARAIHGDDPYGKRLLESCRARGLPALSFGRAGHDVSYGELRFSAGGIEGELVLGAAAGGRRIALRSPLIGAFNAQNLAGAFTAGLGLGLAPETIAEALSRAAQVPGRLERVENRLGLSVVVDYAHTPDALENVLKTLRPLCARRLLCVFGCGGDRDPHKRPLMAAIAERLADDVFVTSDNPRTEDPEAILDQIMSGFSPAARVHRVADRRAAIAAAVAALRLGDILLIAGKGHEDYQIVGRQKLPFDDRKVALENLDDGTA